MIGKNDTYFLRNSPIVSNTPLSSNMDLINRQTGKTGTRIREKKNTIPKYGDKRYRIKETTTAFKTNACS
ncbi:hypothetical protein MBAV_003658 [Candidatus Magnetobacterium bavaricum]|uniref:Uncharacterized protein n=1 Tax=Candidatus Magnetobacterium bavaricum TaxID=29290 RepID=A0A0F3GTW9_9BACT|nr:hypothetical protein MBAV_003658 [Candidatus Magnetobacterium bavaricum]